MFGAISLTSAQVGATVTEGDISGGAGFVKGFDTGVFSYVVRKGHLARIYTDNRRALETGMRVSGFDQRRRSHGDRQSENGRRQI